MTSWMRERSRFHGNRQSDSIDSYNPRVHPINQQIHQYIALKPPAKICRVCFGKMSKLKYYIYENCLLISNCISTI